MEELKTEELHHYCRNCDHQMAEDDKYCGSCGQKNTTGKISVRHLIGDFLEDNFHLNAQLPRTLFVLFFKPGRLTLDYFQGKHKTYFKPIRIFAVTAIIFFAAIAFNISKQMGDFSLYNKGHDKIMQLEMADSIHEVILDSLESVKLQTNSQRINTLLDSAFAPFTTDLDSLLNDTSEFSVINLNGAANTKIRVSKRDLYTLTDKEIVEKYHPGNFWDRLLMRQSLRIFRDSKAFGMYSIKYVSWMFFLMIPFFALFLKLIYIRRKIYYVEHLVFTFHIHAFFFLIMTMIIIIDEYLDEPLETYIDLAWILGLFIYIFVALKRVYQQGFWKTLIKFFLLLGSYFVIFLAFLIGAVLISAAFF